MTRWALSRPRSATLPEISNGTRCGKIPPRTLDQLCHLTRGCSSARFTVCHVGLRAGPAAPGAMGAFPTASTRTSPRSCQQQRQIWGSHCLHSGLQSPLARGPQTGSTHWGTVALRAIWHLGQWRLGQRLHTTRMGVRGSPGACWEGEWRGPHHPSSPSHSSAAQFGQ